MSKVQGAVVAGGRSRRRRPRATGSRRWRGPSRCRAGGRRHPAVRQGQPGGLVVDVEPRLGPRGPARAEGADGGVEGVVGAGQRQRGGGAGEGEVDLVLEEVAGGGVDRVVGVAGGRRGAVVGRRVDDDVVAGRVDAGRLEADIRAESDSVETAPSPPAAAKASATTVGPLDVLVVGGEVLVEAGEDARGVDPPPLAAGLEVVVDGAERSWASGAACCWRPASRWRRSAGPRAGPRRSRRPPPPPSRAAGSRGCR